MEVFRPLQSPTLISRKIWVTQKYWNILTVRYLSTFFIKIKFWTFLYYTTFWKVCVDFYYSELWYSAVCLLFSREWTNVAASLRSRKSSSSSKLGSSCPSSSKESTRNYNFKKKGFFSKEVLLTVLITNLVSFLVGAGLG